MEEKTDTQSLIYIVVINRTAELFQVLPTKKIILKYQHTVSITTQHQNFHFITMTTKMIGKLLNPFRYRGTLKLVHPGGRVECYNMPMPASKLMERYPSFVLTKPNVFKQPWDSIVQPEETLFPGQKFFLVPKRTVQKLRLKVQNPSTKLASFASNAPSINSVSRCTKIKKAKISAKKCFCIDKSDDHDESLVFSKSVNAGSIKSRGKKVVQVAAWHPALESISEM